MKRTKKRKSATEQPTTETSLIERQTLGSLLRQAITNSGKSQREIERLAGIGFGQVSRFMSGERDLTLGTADKLAASLGLSFSPTLTLSNDGGEPSIDPNSATSDHPATIPTLGVVPAISPKKKGHIK